MSSTSDSAGQSRKPEILVAIIGLMGVLITALISNVDKIFPKGQVVTATYTGYRPTGNFETELRCLMEVNGTRNNMISMQKNFENSIKMNMIQQYPQDAKNINKYIEFMDKKNAYV
jgi:hypothetical protein